MRFRQRRIKMHNKAVDLYGEPAAGSPPVTADVPRRAARRGMGRLSFARPVFFGAARLRTTGSSCVLACQPARTPLTGCVALIRPIRQRDEGNIHSDYRRIRCSLDCVLQRHTKNHVRCNCVGPSSARHPDSTASHLRCWFSRGEAKQSCGKTGILPLLDRARCRNDSRVVITRVVHLDTLATDPPEERNMKCRTSAFSVRSARGGPRSTEA